MKENDHSVYQHASFTIFKKKKKKLSVNIDRMRSKHGTELNTAKAQTIEKIWEHYFCNTHEQITQTGMLVEMTLQRKKRMAAYNL